jgi:hypothetical protein
MTVIRMKQRTADATPPASLAPGEIAFYLTDGEVLMWVGDASGVPFSYRPATATGDAPPAQPTAGMLWYRTSVSPGLYMYYVDPTSSQWIAV